MGFARAQVAIPRDTSVPEDISVNVFHFITPSTVSSGAASIQSQLITFYQAIDAFLSPLVASPATLKVYDLEEPAPRVPVFTGTISLTPAASGLLPEECALCVSYQATRVAGQNQARRRGRIYLGPLASATVISAGGRAAVDATARSAIVAAADALSEPPGGLDAQWAVFSPTTAGAEPWSGAALSSAFYPVDNGWVDDAFDTQRRRGPDAQTRSLFT